MVWYRPDVINVSRKQPQIPLDLEEEDLTQMRAGKEGDQGKLPGRVGARGGL